MKTTSIEANTNAENSGLKYNHKRKILNVLDGEMTGKEIASKAGISYYAVMRRMSELENKNKVEWIGKRSGYGLYIKINK